MTTLDLAIKAEAAVLERLSLSERIAYIERRMASPIPVTGLRRWFITQFNDAYEQMEKVA